MNKMATALMEALRDAGLDPDPTYSGRGMYGDTCVSCDTNRDDGVYQSTILDAVKDIPGAMNFSTDSMGLDTVLYWRGAKTTPEDVEAYWNTHRETY